MNIFHLNIIENPSAHSTIAGKHWKKQEYQDTQKQTAAPIAALPAIKNNQKRKNTQHLPGRTKSGKKYAAVNMQPIKKSIEKDGEADGNRTDGIHGGGHVLRAYGFASDSLISCAETERNPACECIMHRNRFKDCGMHSRGFLNFRCV